MPLLSVIVPVYNAEKTLKRCIDSIVNQKFDDYELILINDGSKDSSADICREYACNGNVVYIEKENGGVSSARNAGIACASGKYITFVDSDDFVSDDYFENISGAVKTSDRDYILFSYYCKHGDDCTLNSKTPFDSEDKDAVFRKVESMICNKQINSPLARVYKKEIIDKYGVDFTVGVNIAEDRAFNIKYSLNISSMAVSEKPVYYVSLDNEDSLSRKKDRELEAQFLAAEEDILSAIQRSELDKKYIDYVVNAINFCKYRNIYSNAKRNRLSGKSSKERIRQIKKECKELNKLKLPYPNTRYCHMICLPVKLRLIPVIDLVSYKLAK